MPTKLCKCGVHIYTVRIMGETVHEICGKCDAEANMCNCPPQPLPVIPLDHVQKD